MGCVFGTPLPQISNVNASGQPAAPAGFTSASEESGRNQNDQQESNNSAKVTINEEEDDQEQIVSSFFSFSSFITKNKNPVIFEWLFQKEIGKGSMSRVFLAQHTETGELYAAKVYNKALLLRQTLGNEEPPFIAVQREIEIMAAINHRYVIPLSEVIEDDMSNSLIMVMPYAKHGTLQSFIEKKPLSDESLSVCFHQIAEALKYVHSLNIVHRDIKPENILVFSETFYSLSDFSVSSALTTADEKLVDTRGSPAFLSPEECCEKSFLPKPADVWAYGVSLYASAFNMLPFNLDSGQGKTVANTVYTVSQLLKNEELKIPESASDGLREVLEWVLVKDVQKRPTFEEIVQHWWFEKARKIDEQNIAAKKKAEEEEENEADKSDIKNAFEIDSN